jgi:hypothetical protein
LADLSTVNPRTAGLGAAIALEPGVADSDGACGEAMAAGLCSGACAKLGWTATPAVATARAAMMIRGLIQGLLSWKIFIVEDSHCAVCCVPIGTDFITRPDIETR